MAAQAEAPQGSISSNCRLFGPYKISKCLYFQDVLTSISLDRRLLQNSVLTEWFLSIRSVQVHAEKTVFKVLQNVRCKTFHSLAWEVGYVVYYSLKPRLSIPDFVS